MEQPTPSDDQIGQLLLRGIPSLLKRSGVGRIEHFQFLCKVGVDGVSPQFQLGKCIAALLLVAGRRWRTRGHSEIDHWKGSVGGRLAVDPSDRDRASCAGVNGHCDDSGQGQPPRAPRRHHDPGSLPWTISHFSPPVCHDSARDPSLAAIDDPTLSCRSRPPKPGLSTKMERSRFARGRDDPRFCPANGRSLNCPTIAIGARRGGRPCVRESRPLLPRLLGEDRA
jgi:hypothetical protein